MEPIEATPAKRGQYESKSIHKKFWLITYRDAHPNFSQDQEPTAFQGKFVVLCFLARRHAIDSVVDAIQRLDKATVQLASPVGLDKCCIQFVAHIKNELKLFLEKEAGSTFGLTGR